MEYLAEQGERRDEDEDIAHAHAFGDPQGHEGLAGAARHERGGAVVLAERGEDVVAGFGLMRERGLAGACDLRACEPSAKGGEVLRRKDQERLVPRGAHGFRGAGARRRTGAGLSPDRSGRAEKAYFDTRLIERKQYDAVLRLLEVFAQHLSLAEIARHVHTSTFHFCKTFKRATGMTFTQYLSMVRIAKAKKLLANPQARNTEVAYEAGFASLTHFNRMFRRITGQSPTDFRRQISNA